MPDATTVAVGALAVSLGSLVVSVLSLWNARQTRKNSERLEQLQYSPILKASLALSPVTGITLPAELRLFNTSEKILSLNDIRVIGEAQASVGDFFNVASINLVPNGALPIKAGESQTFQFSFTTGTGTLRYVKLNVVVYGDDARMKPFGRVIALGNCL